MRDRLKNCTAVPRAPVVHAPSEVVQEDLNKVNGDTTLIENQAANISSDNQGTEIGVIDSDEQLHGEWMIVRRKKKNGNEKKKVGGNVNGDKGKNNGAKEIPATEPNHLKIPRKEKVVMGSPNLLTFPNTTTSLASNSSRGKTQDNNKKRARR
ncbi:hypothetical protein RIF29_15928 [Crotalaria pallida]|uniref:Uncharacterized protein n=1 Tax=Crotalaria pallida TaxID=3830 RepID=A0AAN9FEE8_CROPI